ncbi:MAG: DUF2341 domain-containing protein [bacterium]|nr:DUF2341 domain-containing protein [bacterium]
MNKGIRSLKVIILIFTMAISIHADWWDANWPYRRAMTIDNSLSPDTLWNYSIKFNVIYETTMKSDFSDIRFIGYDSSILLPYWIQRYAISDSAVVWVKVPLILAFDTTKIYMYYGNISAIYKGNPDSLFDFFDDFSSNPNNNGKWGIHRYANDLYNECCWDSISGKFYLTRAAYSIGVAAFCNYTLNVKSWTMEFDYLIGGNSGGADGIVAMFYKNKGVYGTPAYGGYLGFTLSNLTPVVGYGIEFDHWYNVWDNSNNHIALMKDTYSNHLTSIDDMRTEDNLWHSTFLNFQSGKVLLKVDNDTIINYNIVSPDYTYSGIGFSSSCGYAGNNNHIIDNVIIRKSTYLEPSISPDSEEMKIELPSFDYKTPSLCDVSTFNNVYGRYVTFSFKLNVKGNVSLVVYNLVGEKIQTLIENMPYSVGTHKYLWNLESKPKAKITQGIYIYVLELKTVNKLVGRETNKIIVLK